jgi:hypothetical protein
MGTPRTIFTAWLDEKRRGLDVTNIYILFEQNVFDRRENGFVGIFPGKP